jgi:hypothetical protein
MFVSVLLYVACYFKNSFDIGLKYFVAYLFFNFLFEMITLYKDKDNLPIYNLLTLIEFNCLFFFLKDILELKLTKKKVIIVIVIFNIIYVLSSVYYLIIDCFFTKYNLFASISGSVLLTLTLFLFFKDFLNSNKILNFRKTITFWISFGLLVYYLGTIPITSIMNSMKNISKTDLDMLFNIQIFLSIFMYSCFIFGALWNQKQVK